MIIKPIESIYKGYRFRSRLEARWAVFLDTLQIPWEFENQGYDLGDEILYLPDFWLPEQNCFMEIKGQQPTIEECIKAHRLAIGTKKDVIVLWGEIGSYPDDSGWIFSGILPPENIETWESDLREWGAFGDDNNYRWYKPRMECGWARTTRPEKLPMFDLVFMESNYTNREGDEIIVSAYKAGRAARFAR